MCDIGYLIKDHVPALMQMLAHRLPQYNMQLITTKCLNTAVMIMYLFLGHTAIRYTGFCDVPVVQKRYRETGNKSQQALSRFKSDILSTHTRTRELYYVMLTDGNTPYTAIVTQGSPQSVYFPGHVFVVEKLPVPQGRGVGGSTTRSKPVKTITKRRPRFNIYQSYIGEYDLAGHIARNKSLACSYDRMASDIVPGLTHMFEGEEWDSQDNAFWKRLTFVDGSQWMGTRFNHTILFCFTKVSTDVCVSHLHTMLSETRADLAARLANNSTVDNGVYGAWNCQIGQTPEKCFHVGKHSSQLLTNREMLGQLDTMLAKI
jgi:hypothetical protein